MATEFITDVVTPATLTGFVRELVDGALPFADLFPPVSVEDIEYELSQADLTNVGEVARYRSWDTAPPIGRRPGVSEIKGEIPPLGWSYRLNEKDVLRFERVRAGVAERFDNDVVNVLFNDAERAAHAVQNRITIAHGDLLTTGSVHLTELGDPVTNNELIAAFAVPANQLGVVPATVVWSNHAAAVPVTDLKAWEAIFRANNGGRNPDEWRISSELMADLTANAQLINLAFPFAGTQPGMVSQEVILNAFKIGGVQAPIRITNDVERPSLTSSTSSRVINNRKVIGVLRGLGSTLYGISPNAATLAGNGEIAFSDTPGIIAYVEQGIRPAYKMTTAEAVALPVLRNPAGLFVATA